MWLHTSVCMWLRWCTAYIWVKERNMVPFSEHVCKVQTVSNHTHAGTILDVGICLSPPLSANKEAKLFKSSPRNTKLLCKPLARVWECTYHINHTWPVPPGTMCMLKHYINNKHASVIFSSIQRMYMFVSLCLTPLHSPSVLVKASAAVNSMCHKKDRQWEADLIQER